MVVGGQSGEKEAKNGDDGACGEEVGLFVGGKMYGLAVD